MMSYPAGLESSFTTVGLSFNPWSLEQKQIFFYYSKSRANYNGHMQLFARTPKPWKVTNDNLIVNGCHATHLNLYILFIQPHIIKLPIL